MSLSTLNIDALLEQITDKYIGHSDYSTLRNACLNLLPVSDVTAEIRKELIRFLEEDKQNSYSQLTSDACQKQIQQDLKEKEQDHQENQKDLELLSQLQNKLISVQTQMRLNDIQINDVEVSILRHQSLIKELERQIVLTSQTHSHPESVDKQTHSHPEPVDKQTHSHPEPVVQHTHSHPNTPNQLQKTTHVHSETPHQHDHGYELSLELQKKTQELLLLQNDLSQKQKLRQELLGKIQEINAPLNTMLPEKEKQRNERNIARKQREQARLYEEPTEKELSRQNYRSLQRSIEDSHEKLEKKQKQLMQKATEMSYQTFLKRLEFNLQSLTLNYHAKEALIQIIRHMQNYLLAKAEEHKQSSIHRSATLDKEKLIEDKNQKEGRVVQLKKANPQLHTQNQTLKEVNRQLEHAIEERGSYRDYLLKIGLFGLLGSGVAVGGGFLGMYMIPMALISLCFAPAAVVGFITVGFFIATLAYTLKNNSDNNQLEHNKTTIQYNITAISKQSGEIISLEQEILPSLNKKISEAEKNIGVLDKKIVSFQQQAERLLHQAKQVVVSNASNQAFFSSETHLHTTQSEVKPTAPKLEEDKRSTLSCS